MKVNEKLLERVNNIQDQLKNVQHLNMNNLVDLKKAKEAIRVIKEDFNKMLEESPLYAKLMDIITKFINYDVKADIDKWENLISDKINELTSKASNTASECAGCTCNCEECDPDYCSDGDCQCDDELEDDFGDIEITLEDDPLSTDELIEDYMDSELVEMVGDKKDTFVKLIADYLNEEHNYLDRIEDDEQIEYLANVLMDFINYTMNR